MWYVKRPEESLPVVGIESKAFTFISQGQSMQEARRRALFSDWLTDHRNIMIDTIQWDVL
jgi:hypothetical protein